MNRAQHDDIVRAFGENGSGLIFEPITGGFTDSEKFVVRNADGESEAMFAKIVDADNELEALVLDTEADHYKTLGELGLTGTYFPRFRRYVNTPQTRALLIDHLPGVSWGGPWSLANIVKLLDAVTAVHEATLSEEQKTRVRQTADTLMEYLYRQSANTLSDDAYARLFEQSWTEDKSYATNSRGQRYFTAGLAFYKELKAAAGQYDKKDGERVILRDTNFNNIAVAADRVIFVDPAYLDIGNPSSDMVSLGLNVLLVTPDDEAHQDVRQFVKDEFIVDRLALARLVHDVLAVGMLPYGDGDNAWMDYHQQMAEVALHTWRELFGRSERN